MPSLKISAVSYLNTLPFIYGIKKSGFLDDYELSLDVPSVCADKVIQKKADIGLIPVGALLKIPAYRLQSDYCIGAQGKVKSVLLLSNKPLDKIKKIYLDTESRTSVALARLLAMHFWKIQPEYFYVPDGGNDRYRLLESVVVIGDKAFGLEPLYEFSYDLAAEWNRFTGLPFVFAVWASGRKLPDEQENAFAMATEYGVSCIKETIEEAYETSKISIDLDDYYRNCLSYPLDDEKKKGMNLFLDYLKKANFKQ
jgi:chorismate dehydratase